MLALEVVPGNDLFKVEKVAEQVDDAARVATTVDRFNSTTKADKTLVNVAKVQKGSKIGTWTVNGGEVAFDTGRKVNISKNFIQQANGTWKAVEKIENVKILYHYTSDKGLEGILSSGQLNPSLKANNPLEARYGNGQYFSDIVPGTNSNAVLSKKF